MFPMQMLSSMFGGNPIFQRAQEMSKGKSENEIMEVCKNICKQRGFDFDQMKSQFENQMNAMNKNMRK